MYPTIILTRRLFRNSKRGGTLSTFPFFHKIVMERNGHFLVVKLKLGLNLVKHAIYKIKRLFNTVCSMENKLVPLPKVQKKKKFIFEMSRMENIQVMNVIITRVFKMLCLSTMTE